MPSRGHWIRLWVPEGFTAELKPLPQWDTRPPEFYCMKRSEIVCRLFLRDIRPDLYDYCITNAVLPPPRLRKWRLEKWIEDHRTAALAVVNLTSHVPVPSRPGVRELRANNRRSSGARGRTTS